MAPFEIHGAEATAQAGDVTLRVVGTPERQFCPGPGSAGPEGIRQQVTATLRQGSALRLVDAALRDGLTTPGAVEHASRRGQCRVADRRRRGAVRAIGAGLPWDRGPGRARA